MSKKLKKRVPELRFPEFHGDWITDRIDHFLVRYVNPVDVQLQTIELESIVQHEGKLINKFDHKEQQSIKNKFRSGDVLFSKVRPY